MEILKKYYSIDKKNIGFLKFIFEAYEGIAVVTTTGKEKNKIVLRIAMGFEDDVDMVLDDLNRRIMISEIKDL